MFPSVLTFVWCLQWMTLLSGSKITGPIQGWTQSTINLPYSDWGMAGAADLINKNIWIVGGNYHPKQLSIFNTINNNLTDYNNSILTSGSIVSISGTDGAINDDYLYLFNDDGENGMLSRLNMKTLGFDNKWSNEDSRLTWGCTLANPINTSIIYHITGTSDKSSFTIMDVSVNGNKTWYNGPILNLEELGPMGCTIINNVLYVLPAYFAKQQGHYVLHSINLINLNKNKWQETKLSFTKLAISDDIICKDFRLCDDINVISIKKDNIDYMYFIGGIYYTPTPITECYSINDVSYINITDIELNPNKTAIVQVGPSLSQPMSDGLVVNMDNKIYIFGGSQDCFMFESNTTSAIWSSN